MAPIRPDEIKYLTGELSERPYPSGVSRLGEGGKFTPDGSVQLWPGNTFVCHVDPQSQAHHLIRELQEEIKKSPFNRFFTFLPAASFHMTVLQGFSATTMPGKELPTDPYDGLGRDDVSELMLGKLADTDLPKSFKIRADGLFAGHSLSVSGADQAEEQALRETRIALSEKTGLTFSDFDDYVFHITLSYLLDWLSEHTARELVDFSATLGAGYSEAIGVINLGPVEFCNFETMHHFEPIRAYS